MEPPQEESLLRQGLLREGVASSFGMAMILHYIQQQHPSTLPHLLPFLCSTTPPRVHTQYERACPEILPGLDTPGFIVTPDTDRAMLPPPLAFINTLEAAFPAIRSEFLRLNGHQGFQPYYAPGSRGDGTTATPELGTDSGAWSVCYLQLHNAGVAEGVEDKTLERCPQVALALKGVARPYKHAFFSVLHPGTHIQKHCGPTNKKVRVHLPLVVPPNGVARLRVGGKTVVLEEGRCVAFQDSWEHEAWLDEEATSSRATLVVDVWHPMLTDEEVKALGFIKASSMRGSKAASEAGVIPLSQDYFKALQCGRKAGVEDKAVFFGCPVVED
jgi:aspartate beta-hydroxylase